MVRELKPEQFTERLEPIFRSVESRLSGHLQGRNAEYFFPHWRRLMELGVARTWELLGVENVGSGNVWGAVLGALFTPDIFGGVPQANVVFWFAIPGTRGTSALLDAVEQAAKDAGAALQIAAYDELEGERIAAIYRARGYAQTERIFRKEKI